MGEQKYSDKKILQRFHENPQEGMILLMERYTGLLWYVASQYLKNPEDVKECVNDTFTAFYFKRDAYQEEKASLSVYLTALVKNKAISVYRRQVARKEVDYEEGLLLEDRKLSMIEEKMDVERALKELRPEELEIIRMKYYDGMTIREIAESLKLPYETVKKRHQRSIKKLKKSIVLLLLMLVFMLFSVGVYAALRHFNIIPSITEWGNPFRTEEEQEEVKPKDLNLRIPSGLQEEEPDDVEVIEGIGEDVEAVRTPESKAPVWESEFEYSYVAGIGINKKPEEQVYVCNEQTTWEGKDLIVKLKEITYISGELFAVTEVHSKTLPFSKLTKTGEELRICEGGLTKLIGGNREWDSYSGTSSGNENDNYELEYQTKFKGEMLWETISSGEELLIEGVVVTTGEQYRFPFHMEPLEQQKVEEQNYQMKELGGIMAIPRLEEGSLIVSVYPLDNGGDCRILPGILWDSYGGGSEQGCLTVTKDDGTVLEGNCIRYHPQGDETYFDWDFGPAEPGKYTIHIPYVILEGIFTDKMIPVDLEKNIWEDREYPIPGGTITVKSCMPVEVKPKLHPLDPSILPPSDPEDMFLYCPYLTGNQLQLQVKCQEENCTLFNIFMSGKSEEIEVDPEKEHRCSVRSLNDVDMTAIDREQGSVEYLVQSDPFTTDKSSFWLGAFKNVVNYKWNQPFDISFTIE